MRAALYVRQSLDVAEGIERQLDRCRKLIADKGWTVTREYTDNDVSASKVRGAGTAWARMLDETDQWDALVAVDLDRLIRGNRDLLELIDRGVSIVTVDGQVNLASADGEFRASIMASVARFEVRRKSERQVRGADFRAAKGIPMTAKRPFGYDADMVTLHPVESVWLQWMHAQIIAGGTVYSIVRHLNREGVTTAGGAQWSAAQVKAVLRRQRNAGIFVRHGAVQAVSAIVPAVSVDDHELVVSILAAEGGKRGPKPQADNWLSGVMHCPCGAPMAQKLSRSKGRATRTYSCSAKLRGHEVAGPHSHIAASVAEPHIEGFLFAMTRTGVIREPSNTVDIRAVQVEIAEVERQKSAALDVLMDPDITDKSRVKARLVTLEARAAELVQVRNRLAAQTPEATALEELAAMTSTHEGFLAVRAMSPESKRTLVATYLRIVVQAGGYGAKRIQVEFL